jgi:xanthine phosphoribosyltransferase
MEFLEKAILEKGKVLPGGVLKVGSFLNNLMDARILKEIGKEIHSHFKGCGVTKILTIEASGIGIACVTAQFFDCPVLFAKKSKTSNLDGEFYTAECFSYTHQKTNVLFVPKDFLSKEDKVLIVDDFLAHGEATKAVASIIEQSGATLCGIAIAVEKGFQGAGDEWRKKGVDILSLAIVDKMEDGKIEFRK